MTLRRWTILVAYVLAALVAPGWHDHGADRPEAPEASAGCEAGGLHLANHPDAPDLSDHADHCPACQVRADVAVPIACLGRVVPAPSHTSFLRENPLLRLTATRLPLPRGPPIV